MSLSVQSSTHAVAKTTFDYDPVSATKTGSQSPKAAVSATKVSVPVPKPAPKLDEAAQIQQLAQQGHSDQQIADSIGLPEDVVALTLGDSTTTASTTSSASALVALSARLSVVA